MKNVFLENGKAGIGSLIVVIYPDLDSQKTCDLSFTELENSVICGEQIMISEKPSLDGAPVSVFFAKRYEFTNGVLTGVYYEIPGDGGAVEICLSKGANGKIAISTANSNNESEEE